MRCAIYSSGCCRSDGSTWVRVRDSNHLYPAISTTPSPAVWLDVERSELSALLSIDFAAVSIGVIIVEMRSAEWATNPKTLSLLAAEGFELVCSRLPRLAVRVHSSRCSRTVSAAQVGALPIWNGHLYDLVFLRGEHFVAERPAVLPRAALRYLALFARRHTWRIKPGRLSQGAGALRREIVAQPYVLNATRLMRYLAANGTKGYRSPTFW